MAYFNATFGRSRDGSETVRVDASYTEYTRTADGGYNVGHRYGTFEYTFPQPQARAIGYGDQYQYYNDRPGRVTSNIYSYSGYAPGPPRPISPPRRSAPARRIENNNYSSGSSYSSAPAKKPATATAPKKKVPLVAIPAKNNTKGKPKWDDSAHDAWKCANWEEFAKEAAQKVKINDKEEAAKVVDVVIKTVGGKKVAIKKADIKGKKIDSNGKK